MRSPGGTRSAGRAALGRVELVARVDVAELEPLAQPARTWPAVWPVFGERLVPSKSSGIGTWGRKLMLGPVRAGGRAGPRRSAAVLHRGDAPRRKAAAVAGLVDQIDDRVLDVAGAQEVGVHRVHDPRPVHGALRRAQRLPQHLPAEHELRADVAALAAEDRVLDALQAHQIEQFDQFETGKSWRDYTDAPRPVVQGMRCEPARLEHCAHGNNGPGSRAARRRPDRRWPAPVRYPGPRGRRCSAATATALQLRQQRERRRSARPCRAPSLAARVRSRRGTDRG